MEQTEITIAKVDGTVRAIVRFPASLESQPAVEQERLIEQALWRAAVATTVFLERERITGQSAPMTTGIAA